MPALRVQIPQVHENGPIAIAIEPNDDFMYYEQGVYEHASALFDEWTKVDRAELMTQGVGDRYQQTSNGSFSAVWTATIVRKDALCSIF